MSEQPKFQAAPGKMRLRGTYTPPEKPAESNPEPKQEEE